MDLIMYLTEKVAQNLLCEGGRHGAELERKEGGSFRQFLYFNQVW